jgi:serine/threonine protein kinase
MARPARLAPRLLGRDAMTTAWALPPADPCPIEAPDSLGFYDVLGLIAEGGMGKILRGRDRLSGLPVALKTVRSQRRADAASIRREILALSRMSHPGIIRFVAEGGWRGMPWMALELLEGRTVCDEIDLLWRKGPEGLFQAQHGRCRSEDVPTMPAHFRAVRRSPVPAARNTLPLAAAGRLHDVVGIAANLCVALDYVHGLGLVHRDVKPSNVFLGDDGRVTLLDFGLVCPARGAPGSCESADSCVGTMEYAAPEQIRGEPVDARADLYSLGCMLYELVTGRRPVDATEPSALGERPGAKDPLAPSALVAGVPRPLEELVFAMLAKRPEDRPASAAIVGAALATIAAGTANEVAVQPASLKPTRTAQTASSEAATITIA